MMSYLQTETNHKMCIIISSGWSHYYASDSLLIFNCLSQFLPLFVDKQWWEFRTLQRTFEVMSVFCTERQKQLQLRGFVLYCGSPRNGQEGRILHTIQRPISVRNDCISQSQSPSVGSQVKSYASQAKHNRVLSLYMQGNYVEIHNVETLQYSLYPSMDNEKKKRTERKEKSL